jgi:hypothetical protein
MRIQPVGPASAYKTYSVKAPISTHFRKATCEEISCPDFLYGWRVRVESLTPVLLHTAKNCGRKFTQVHVSEGETFLVYEAGQTCFHAAKHRTRIERPELYIVRDGDRRGNPRGTPDRIHKNGVEWAEDLHEHTDKLAEARKDG